MTSRIHRIVSASTCALPKAGVEIFDIFAKGGLFCAEISVPGAEYPSFPYAEATRRAKDAGVDVRSFHLPFYTDETVDPASLDPEIRRRTAEIQKHFIHVAAEMGASIAVVHAGLEPVGDAERAERGMHRVAARLLRASARIRRLGGRTRDHAVPPAGATRPAGHQ